MKVRPLSARSVVLSLLLGAHPPELPVKDLVAAAELFEIAEPTLRVALTRLVSSGELDRTDGSYRLSARLLERQRRQDAALEPETIDWDGAWELVLITSAGRSPGDRAQLRGELAELRLAELREGSWLRPANLRRPLPDFPDGLVSTFSCTPSEPPAALAERLWDLAGWNATATGLLDGLTTAKSAADRLAIAAAAVRHLRTDPALPDSLLPENWCAPALRTAYSAYQAELSPTR